MMSGRRAVVEPRRSTVVAVLTYRRPQDLAELLPMLEVEVDDAGGDISVMVVDNDPAASARDLCGRVGPRRPRYVHEPRPGIAAARNRALREAAGSDLLVFIDDDERPVSGWLAALLATFATTMCAGVVGPVVSSFGRPLEPWIAAGGFFDRRRLPTGTSVTAAATNNLLLDLRVVRAAHLEFDERFGLTGGSDNLFTRRLVAAGGRLVWCDEAVVTDVVPAQRSTRDWVLRRRLRIGNSWARATLAMAGSPARRFAARMRMAGHGVVRVGGGSARFGCGVATNSMRQRAQGIRTLVHGVGIVGGAFGYTYAEYRRTGVR